MTGSQESHERPSLKAPAAIATSFCTAVRFLTVVPIGWRSERDGELFPLSIFHFPLVGLAIGCGGALLALLAHWLLLPPTVVAFLVVLYLAAISGFLHLDGLADSGDGLLSARPRERSLEIMKDSRTGAMGVVSLILVLVGKYAALGEMAPTAQAAAALLMPLCGRCAILLAMAVQRYARPEGGIGGLFYSSHTRRAALIGWVVLAVVAAATTGWGGMWLLCFATLALVAIFARFCRRRIGGATGDTLGATCELAELVAAISLAAFFHQI